MADTGSLRPPLVFGVAEPVRQILRRRAAGIQPGAIWRRPAARAHVVILNVRPDDDRVVVRLGTGMVALARWDDLALLPRHRRCG